MECDNDKDSGVTFDLVRDEVDRTIERLKSIKMVGNVPLSSVYSEFIKEFRARAYR